MNFNTDLEKCQAKKKHTIKTAKFLKKHLSESAANNNYTCGNLLTFLADETLEKKRLETGYFCKQAFCPACAWRKSVKDAIKIDCIIKQALTERHGVIFITLTTPNVQGHLLSEEIEVYNKALNHMLKLKRFKFIQGIIRKLEVTYNHERQDFHPHLHLIVFTRESYFEDKNQMLSNQLLLKYWRQVTKNPNITQVKIQGFRDKDGQIINADSLEDGSADIMDGVLEIAKYSAKSDDYLLNQSVFDDFYTALNNKRKISFSGCAAKFRTMHDKKELEHFKEYQRDQTQYVYRILYRYYFKQGQYLEAGKQKIEPQLFDEHKEENRARIIREWSYVVREIQIKEKKENEQSDIQNAHNPEST